MKSQTYPEFEAAARANGFEEVLQRQWKANAQVGTHVHPFSVEAFIAEGEMWLTVGSEERHLKAGDVFELGSDVPHSERYGADGTTLWVARRQGRQVSAA
jgi:quercetin dioxygenase-like cupin family protein